MTRPCTVDGCPRPYSARGLCTHHYEQRRTLRPRTDYTFTPWGTWHADDIDYAIVQRLIDGEQPAGYTSWERREAVRQLHRRGWGQRTIARWLGVGPRQVWRDLHRLGLTQERATWLAGQGRVAS